MAVRRLRRLPCGSCQSLCRIYRYHCALIALPFIVGREWHMGAEAAYGIVIEMEVELKSESISLRMEVPHTIPACVDDGHYSILQLPYLCILVYVALHIIIFLLCRVMLSVSSVGCGHSVTSGPGGPVPVYASRRPRDYSGVRSRESDGALLQLSPGPYHNMRSIRGISPAAQRRG